MGEMKLNGCIYVCIFLNFAGAALLLVYGAIGLSNQDATINTLVLVPGFPTIESTGFSVLPYIEGVAIFMVVVGSIVIVITPLGGQGVLKRDKLSSMMFWLGSLLITIPEIALIIYAAVYSIYPAYQLKYIEIDMALNLEQNFIAVIVFALMAHADYPTQICGSMWWIGLKRRLTDSSANVSSNGSITLNSSPHAAAWEQFQFETQCCGAFGPSDFGGNFTAWKQPLPYTINGTLYTPLIPPSCCKTNLPLGQMPTDVTSFENYERCFSASAAVAANSFWSQTCSTVVQSMVYQYSLIAIIVASCLIGVQIVGTVLFINFWHTLDLLVIKPL